LNLKENLYGKVKPALNNIKGVLCLLYIYDLPNLKLFNVFDTLAFKYKLERGTLRACKSLFIDGCTKR
jgi:hypothetical protein